MAKPTKVTVDFSDTESRGGKKGERSAHLPPGDYLVKCVKAVITKSRGEKKTPEIRVTYRVMKGKSKGKQIIDDLYLTEGAVWRLRATLEGMGIPVPSKKANVDPKKMEGRTLGVSVDDDEYEKDDGTTRTSTKVVDSFLESELSDEEPEDEDEDEEDEDEDDDDEDEDDDEDDIDL